MVEYPLRLLDREYSSRDWYETFEFDAGHGFRLVRSLCDKPINPKPERDTLAEHMRFFRRSKLRKRRR